MAGVSLRARAARPTWRPQLAAWLRSRADDEISPGYRTCLAAAGKMALLAPGRPTLAQSHTRPGVRAQTGPAGTRGRAHIELAHDADRVRLAKSPHLTCPSGKLGANWPTKLAQRESDKKATLSAKPCRLTT